VFDGIVSGSIADWVIERFGVSSDIAGDFSGDFSLTSTDQKNYDEYIFDGDRLLGNE
jgi:hypothetical protein